MSSSKIERAMYGPSWTEVIVGAVLSVILGLVLAAVHLVFKPVQTVKEVPKDALASQVFYIEGRKDSGKGQAWLQKQQAMKEGRSVELSEHELNTAVSSSAAKAPAGQAQANEATLSPGALNFRIVDKQLQIALPVKVSLLGCTVIIQTRGSFEKKGDLFTFVPERFYLGSCPLHRLPGMSSLVLGRLYRSQAIPEELTTAWQKLNAIEIDSQLLKLSF